MRYNLVTSRLFLLLMGLLCGCYSVRTIPVEDISGVQDHKILSYVNEEGEEITVLHEGYKFEESAVANDTLTIRMSRKPPDSRERIVFYSHIPLSGISAVKVASDTLILRYGSLGFGLGSGYIAEGVSMDLGYSFIRNNIGGSIRIKEIWSDASDLPDDYTGFFHNDNIFILSGLVTAKTLTEKRNVWYGGGIGPSMVSFNKEIETLNPRYNPDSEDPWDVLNLNKYIRDTQIDKVAGLNLRGEIGLLLSDYFGIEMALWSNLNTFKSLIGLEFKMVFGRVR